MTDTSTMSSIGFCPLLSFLLSVILAATDSTQILHSSFRPLLLKPLSLCTFVVAKLFPVCQMPRQVPLFSSFVIFLLFPPSCPRQILVSVYNSHPGRRCLSSVCHTQTLRFYVLHSGRYCWSPFPFAPFLLLHFFLFVILAATAAAVTYVPFHFLLSNSTIPFFLFPHTSKTTLELLFSLSPSNNLHWLTFFYFAHRPQTNLVRCCFPKQNDLHRIIFLVSLTLHRLISWAAVFPNIPCKLHFILFCSPSTDYSCELLFSQAKRVNSTD